MKLEYREMTVCALISCMFQDMDIVRRTRVQTNAVVVNQCNEDNVVEYDFTNELGKKCHVKFISTRERGLSRSRNMAIRNCTDDVCILCDDDEVLSNGYEGLILEGYKQYPEASVITFRINREYKNHRSYPPAPVKHNLFSILKTNSLEITFKRKDIVSKGIFFDELMGSGTGNGAGEEEKFLMEIRRHGLKLYFYSNLIATVNNSVSHWFKGFNEQYFLNKGWSARRILGGPLSILYLLYFTITHYNLFRTDISSFSLMKSLVKGWVSSRENNEESGGL